MTAIAKPNCWIEEYGADWDGIAAGLKPAPGLEGGYLVAGDDRCELANAVRGGVQSGWYRLAGETDWRAAGSGERASVAGSRYSVEEHGWHAGDGCDLPWHWVFTERLRAAEDAAGKAMAGAWDSLRSDPRWRRDDLSLTPRRDGEVWRLDWRESKVDCFWSAGHPLNSRMVNIDGECDTWEEVIQDRVVEEYGESPARFWRWADSPRFATEAIAEAACGLITAARLEDGVFKD